MDSNDHDPLDSILLNVQIISLDSSQAADQLRIIGETLGDEMLQVACNFIVAHRLELLDGQMPDTGLFKWLAREYPCLPPLVEAVCCAFIADTNGGSQAAAAAV